MKKKLNHISIHNKSDFTVYDFLNSDFDELHNNIDKNTNYFDIKIKDDETINNSLIKNIKEIIYKKPIIDYFDKEFIKKINEFIEFILPKLNKCNDIFISYNYMHKDSFFPINSKSIFNNIKSHSLELCNIEILDDYVYKGNKLKLIVICNSYNKYFKKNLKKFDNLDTIYFHDVYDLYDFSNFPKNTKEISLTYCDVNDVTGLENLKKLKLIQIQKYNPLWRNEEFWKICEEKKIEVEM